MIHLYIYMPKPIHKYIYTFVYIFSNTFTYLYIHRHTRTSRDVMVIELMVTGPVIVIPSDVALLIDVDTALAITGLAIVL